MKAAALIIMMFSAMLSIWLLALHLNRRGYRVPTMLLSFLGFPVVYLRDGAIHDCALFRCRTLKLDHLERIEYACQAVVGFSAVWIFSSKQGDEVAVLPYRAGLFRLLTDLAAHCPGFSLSTWRQEFADGDVEDTLLLWKAVPDSSGEPLCEAPRRQLL
jgi:hypothetical protein